LTLAGIAAELGVDEKVARRVLARVLAKLRDGAAEIDADPIFFSTVIVCFLEGTVRFSDISREGDDMPPRVSQPDSRSSGERAGRIPRRFGVKHDENS
jgi:hypothetical protein